VLKRLVMMSAAGLTLVASAQTAQQVVDVPTRNGVTQRVLFLSPPEPKATFLLFPGGHGGLGIFPNGSLRWGEGNFLVRSRQLFVDQGVAVAVVDAPSDRQSPPYLSGARLARPFSARLCASRTKSSCVQEQLLSEEMRCSSLRDCATFHQAVFPAAR
jgi:hypothetical protein